MSVKSVISSSIILLIGLASVSQAKQAKVANTGLIVSKSFDLEGHRGARGLMPENTIPAFKKALDIGVNTLEMDTAITKDKKIIVSHEPWFSSEICLTPDGKTIDPKKEMNNAIYQMNYEQVIKFDCGTKKHPRFPKQFKMKIYKPLLDDVISQSEAYIKTKGLKPVQYNIELKSLPDGDNKLHPIPSVYAKMLYDDLKKFNLMDRIIFQSFDLRELQEIRKIDKKVRLSLLTEKDLSMDKAIKELGFNPDIYSPDSTTLTQAIIDKAHKQNIKVIPWTVNTIKDMKSVVNMHVDGFITDYPNLGKKVLNK